MPKLVPLQRRKVLKILEANGFSVTREGGRHTVVEKQDDTGKPREEFY